MHKKTITLPVGARAVGIQVVNNSGEPVTIQGHGEIAPGESWTNQAGQTAEVTPIQPAELGERFLECRVNDGVVPDTAQSWNPEQN